MMKNKDITVGILTMHGIENYGSYLQTVATSDFLKKQGYIPVVIDYLYPNKTHLETGEAHLANRTRKMPIMEIIRRVLNRMARITSGCRHRNNMAKFNEFYAKHIKLTRSFVSPGDIKNDPPNFDIYLSGSDQIWNPQFVGDDTTYLLSWVPDNKPKIAYSSSFSISQLPQRYKEIYKKYLSRYKAISVREKSNICKELLGVNAKVTLDPTFLLGKKDWKRYIDHKPIISGRYILCYVLNYKFNPYPYIKKLINYVQRQTGLDVVMIEGNKFNMEKGWSNIVDIGPADFINLIYNSEFVITTSFHGTAFAVNFEKNFFSLINDEYTLDNRQKSLLRMLEMQECLLKKNTPLSSIVLPKIDYGSKNKLIEHYRKESKRYFEEALR